MKDTDYAYMAGVLDADGFLSIRKQSTNPRFPESRTFSEFIGVGQVVPDAVSLFQGAFGGKIHLRSREHENWKSIYYWTISNKLAAACVLALRPYLRVKARQADLILLLRASKETPHAERRNVDTGGRGRSLNEEVLAEREAWYREIRSLNDSRHRPDG